MSAMEHYNNYNSDHLRNKTCSPCLNRGIRLGEFKSRSVKTRDAVEGFSLAREISLSQTLPRFSPGYESTENMFYFL